MNPAIFKLANLNLTVTIDAKARQWATENYVSLEACAWEFALKHKAGQRPFVPSAGRITVEPTRPDTRFWTLADECGDLAPVANNSIITNTPKAKEILASLREWIRRNA